MEHFSESIEKLKKDLNNFSVSSKSREKLLEEREKVEQKIEIERHELKNLLLAIHRMDVYNTQKASLLRTQWNQKEKDLEVWTKRLKEIDEILDQSQEYENISFEELQKQLIQAVLSNYPESKDQYALLETSLRAKERAKSEFSSFLPQLNQIEDSLRRGKDIYLKGLKRSFFAFLFDRHPKVLLSQEIRKAVEESKEFLPLLKAKLHSGIEEKNLRETYAELLLFLETLTEEFAKRWNPRLYNDDYLLLVEKFLSLKQEIDQELNELNKKILSLKKEILEWAERHA